MSANTRSLGDLFSYGTSGERLAIDVSSIPPLYRFFETDTGTQYHWDGTTWVVSAFFPSGSKVANSNAISVEDNRDAWSNSGACFAGRMYSPPVASQYSIIQFENPSTSGKTIYIDSIKGEGGLYLLRRAYPLQGTTSQLSQYLPLSNGSVTVFNFLKTSVTTSPAGFLALFIDNVFFTLKYPIIIRPGEILSFGNVTANSSCGVGMMWREV